MAQRFPGHASLVGVELARPMITREARLANFTNETGVGGTSRFLRNASGMWLLQECRRAWAVDGQDYSYAELARLAEQADRFRSIIDPDDPSFLRPEHMPTAIAEFCSRAGQPVPASAGDFARCILESLGLLYDCILTQIERVSGRRIDILHVVGGGSQNALLNQITADATGRKVISGPVEATAIGNLMLQALSLGHVNSLQELRDAVRESFALQTFEPSPDGQWAIAKERFLQLHRLA
jgi:rhamnulokinase